MKKSLLDIVLIHHPDDQVSEPYVNAVTRAFEYLRPDKSVSQVFEAEDPWERVQVLCCNSAADVNRALLREETPTVYLVLVSDLLVNSTDFAAALNQLAELLPGTNQGRRNAICYSYSDTAMQSLPAKFSSRQVLTTAALGENRIRPFRLALQALHRARRVLGLPDKSNTLKLFLSHAKADGVFFAQALKHAIDQVPELECIYDDADIQSGSEYSFPPEEGPCSIEDDAADGWNALDYLRSQDLKRLAEIAHLSPDEYINLLTTADLNRALTLTTVGVRNLCAANQG